MLPYPVSTVINIFRESQEFGRGRWFQVPFHVLRELYVGTYSLATDEDGDYCGDWTRDAAYLEQQHPGCVFIYLEAADVAGDKTRIL